MSTSGATAVNLFMVLTITQVLLKGLTNLSCTRHPRRYKSARGHLMSLQSEKDRNKQANFNDYKTPPCVVSAGGDGVIDQEES